MMELVKGKKMNWAMCVEWTNQEQWQKRSIIEVMNDEEGDDAIDQLEDDEENLVGSDSCMTLVLPKEIIRYVENSPKSWC